MNLTRYSLTAAPLAFLLLTGCHVVDRHNGDKHNVDIGTPFGSMHVRTDKNPDTTAIGLTAYPGAVPVQDEGKNASSANVDLSFAGFHLGVRAAAFQTPDQQDAVISFYRKDLARYGDVLECRGHVPVGTPTRTSEGLTCNDHTSAHGSAHTGGVNFGDDHSDGLQLRAGSERRQHIVSVEPKDGGTMIGLVALDLPSHLSDHDDKDSE